MVSEALPWRQPLLFQPVETVTPFSFSTVVDEARAVWFPDLECDIEVRIAALGPLASVWYHRMGRDRHIIVFHPLLNRPDMPVEVVRFIAKHELAHIDVPGGHTPEFFEREVEAGPERFAVWAWIHRNLRGTMRDGNDGIAVLRSWRRRVQPTFEPYTPHLPFDDVPWKVLCPEGGAQLRFHPSWSAGPAPFGSKRV